ncbi:hypothetical protein [Stutzerimonas nitrititolerans]|uniref:hypothetical protein n=1 Tax=Stutzerimonas nitrititolerans TaxID=2482751 RepID=UPI003AA89B1A
MKGGISAVDSSSFGAWFVTRSGSLGLSCKPLYQRLAAIRAEASNAAIEGAGAASIFGSYIVPICRNVTGSSGCLIGAMRSVYEGEYSVRMWVHFALELNFCGDLLHAEYVE